MSCLIHGDSKLIGAALDDDIKSNIWREEGTIFIRCPCGHIYGSDIMTPPLNEIKPLENTLDADFCAAPDLMGLDDNNASSQGGRAFFFQSV